MIISLTLENMEHLGTVFAQYLKEYGDNICPEYADSSYVDRKVQYNLHTRGDIVESNVA